MRGWVRRTLPAALLLGVLTGCSSESGEPPSADAVWQDEIKSAEKAGAVGSADSPCALPVSLGLAPSWNPEAVASDGALGEFKQGPVVLTCEIDAKPAGNIGFLRVWTASRAEGSPRQVLDAFVAGGKNIGERHYRETKAGSFPAEEITYVTTGPEPKRERALAVVAPDGVVVLHVGGADTREHEALLPAYVLAKQTMAALSS